MLLWPTVSSSPSKLIQWGTGDQGWTSQLRGEEGSFTKVLLILNTDTHSSTFSSTWRLCSTNWILTCSFGKSTFNDWLTRKGTYKEHPWQLKRNQIHVYTLCHQFFFVTIYQTGMRLMYCLQLYHIDTVLMNVDEAFRHQFAKLGTCATPITGWSRQTLAHFWACGQLQRALPGIVLF